MSVDLTADALIAWGMSMEEEFPFVATDALLAFGYAWQAEVRALRERIAALEADAERWRKLKRIMESAKGGASLEMNQEFAYYEKPEPGSEVQLQWYPHTPVGFYKVNASSLDEAIDGAEE